MNKFPLISVIVPAYNAERWIGECIASVKTQTYPEIELIVIDDGSTDNTFSVASESVVDINNARIIHTENGGVCCARNRGLDEARGEYLFFLDADDALLPTAISDLYDELVAHHADVVIGWGTYMSADGSIKGKLTTRKNYVWEGIESLKKSLMDNPATRSSCGNLYKAETLCGIRFVEGKRNHEDGFFMFEYFLTHPKVVVSGHIVFYYRDTPNSASRSEFSEKFLDILYFADNKKKIVETNFPELMPLAENVIVKANMVLLLTLLKTNDKKYRSLQKECIKRVKNGKRFFIPATPFDRKWFLVITYGLYDVYKFLRKVKYKLKCNF